MKLENLDIESLVQNYVLGRMSDAEVDEFEEYFLSNSEVIEMIEISRVIHVNAQYPVSSASLANDDMNNEGVTSSRPVDPSQVRSKNGSNGGLIERIKGWITIPVPAGALAASCVLALGLSTLLSEPSGPEDVLIASFSTQATRSHSSGAAIDLSNPSGTSALFIKLKSADYALYRVKIIDANTNVEKWVSNDFSVSSLRDKFIPLPQHAAIDNANVSVFGLSDSGEELSVMFCHYSEVCN